MGKDIGTLTFETFNDLRKTTGASLSGVKVLGKDVANDGFGGIFYYNTSSTASDDNDSVIQPTGVITGRWIRLQLTTGVPPPVNIGNTNLSLTSNRLLDGDGFDFSIANIGNLILQGNAVTLAGSSIVIQSFSDRFITIKTLDADVTFNTEELTGNRDYNLPDSSGTLLTEENAETNYAKKPLELATNGFGILTNSYLVNKDLLLLVTSGIILKKGVHFTKTLGSDTVSMISPNTLLPSHIYIPTYG